MFSQVRVSVHRGGGGGMYPSMHLGRQVRMSRQRGVDREVYTPLPYEMATEAGDMHPTRMPSCSQYFRYLVLLAWRVK